MGSRPSRYNSHCKFGISVRANFASVETGRNHVFNYVRLVLLLRHPHTPAPLQPFCSNFDYCTLSKYRSPKAAVRALSTRAQLSSKPLLVQEKKRGWGVGNVYTYVCAYIYGRRGGYEMENGNNVWHRQTALLSSRTGDSSTFRWNSPPSASIRRRIERSLEFSLPLHRTGASGIGCRGFDRFTGGGRLAWSREHRCRENGFRLVGSLLLSSRPRRGRLAATVYSVFLEFNELAVIKGPGTKVAAGVQRRSQADRPRWLRPKSAASPPRDRCRPSTRLLSPWPLRVVDTVEQLLQLRR